MIQVKQKKKPQLKISTLRRELAKADKYIDTLEHEVVEIEKLRSHLVISIREEERQVKRIEELNRTVEARGFVIVELRNKVRELTCRIDDLEEKPVAAVSHASYVTLATERAQWKWIAIQEGGINVAAKYTGFIFPIKDGVAASIRPGVGAVPKTAAREMPSHLL